MRTSNLESAVEELKAKGLSFNMDTAAYDEEKQIEKIFILPASLADLPFIS